MLIRQIRVSDFKGVDVTIPWADVVVLFGRNDAGKTNILEAITDEWPDLTPVEEERSRAFRDISPGSRARDDPMLGAGAPAVDVLIELENLETLFAEDCDVLAHLLQIRHAPPVFPYFDLHLGFGLRPSEVDSREGRSPSRYPAAELVWPFDTGVTFTIGCIGPWDGEEQCHDLAPLADIIASVRYRAIAELDSRAPEWRQIESQVTAVLDGCLSSRWLLAGTHGVLWLTPRPEDVRADVRAAGVAINANQPGLPIVGAFAETLGEGSHRQLPFLMIPDHQFFPWRATTLSASPERLDELAQTVDRFVDENVTLLNYLGDPPYPADPWLHEVSGSFSISEVVVNLCQKLSQTATAIAPPFISTVYDICVEPLPPTHWREYDARRLRLVLKRPDSGERFDLKVVGSGLAAWAALTLEEALRTVGDDLEHQFEAEFAVEDDIDPDIWPESAVRASAPPTTGSIGVLYVLDEPERHLHPRAQEQAARWIVDLTKRGASVVVASHAPSFLSLPTDEAEYVLVARDEEALTRATPITDDVFGLLDIFLEDSGIQSRAELIQIVRGLIIVEGAHDEAVLRHFYTQRLERARILILPTRGAKKVKSLIEAEFLAMLDLPTVILFDDVEADLVTGENPPSKRGVAAHELWQMLNHWPSERKRPNVVSFPLPDVFVALPDACVKRVVELRGGTFEGWEQIVSEFRAGDNLAFKPFVLERCGLPPGTDPTDLLRQILETCRDRPAAELDAAVSRAIDLVNRAWAPSSSDWDDSQAQLE